jgi:hypothetical protein
MLLVATGSLWCYGQVTSTASLAGTVVDQSGGVVPGANVSVKNDATGTEFKAVTADNGTFSIPAMDAGTYTATVTMQGFKEAIYKNITLVAGVAGNVRITLQVGGTNETITVESSAEVLQAQSANIATTMVVNQITQLPMVSRNAMDFVVFLPGVNTTSTNRSSTVNGMPNNVVNITIDGINTQDNFLKGNAGGDGFFSMISPRLDAIEEVTLSTATPGAESAGQGAVQIRFVTRSGNNDFHGSLYEYNRNPDLNSNYWFTNRDTAPTYNGSTTPCTPTQLANEWDKCKAPRARVLLNQPGGRIGGPIILPKKLFGPLGFDGKDKAFFFFNLEEYRLPAQQARTRTIFSPSVEQGIFPYTVGSATQTVNLFTLAQASGQTATEDPTIQKLLSDIRNSASQGTITPVAGRPDLQYLAFFNKGNTVRKLTTTRFDFNLSSKEHLEGSYDFHRYSPALDILNSVDPAFPGFPNQGFQSSNRFAMSTALRSTLTPRLVNEARFGLTGGVTEFWPEINSGQFQTTGIGNEDGYALYFGTAGISSPYRSYSPERRSTPSETITDTLMWTKGSHSISVGFNWTNVGSWVWDDQVVPYIYFGVDTTYGPAKIMFDATNGPKNFPGSSSTQYGYAMNEYAILTGRVTTIGGSGVLSEINNQYTYNAPAVQRGHMRELGTFIQDSWRVVPNFTLNYGVRWEVQFPFTPLNSVYTTNTVDDLWGLSGHESFGNGALYTPGTPVGQVPTFKDFTAGTAAYNTHWKDVAPSLGFAWTPNAKGFLGKFIGENGQSVLRGGFSLAYVRNGMYDYTAMYDANPGIYINATRSMGNGNLVTNTGTNVLPILFSSQQSRLGPPSFAATPVYPIQSTAITDQVNLFDPNTRTPYVMSWSFGLQRELGKDMALEVRYVANKSLQPWAERNLNEQNIVENGFLNEFKLAMANLYANEAAGRGNNFKYYGANTGTSPLPITLAYFSGIPASQASDPSKYTSSNFSSTTYVNTLAKYNPAPFTYEVNLWSSSATQRSNALAAGLPANEFVVNPTVASGGAWISTNGGFNWYNSMQIELRRRLAKGLLVQSSYVYARGEGSSRDSYRDAYRNVLGGQLPSAFKVNFVYELPFGSGREFFGSAHGVVDRLIGGWQFEGAGRWQSGAPLDFGNVQLVGMTPDQLRSQIGLRFDDANREVFYEPAAIINNTIAAYNVSATTSTGYSTSYGVPTGAYIAPANQNSNGCITVVTGDCAGRDLFIRGPRFQRFDLSVVKRIRFTETKNFELRGEFLNAFNNINFYGTTCASTSASCGLITSAYTDSSNTQDPGGRLIQIVLRVNF